MWIFVEFPTTPLRPEGDLFVAIKGEKSDGARLFLRPSKEGCCGRFRNPSCIRTGYGNVIVPDARSFSRDIPGVLTRILRKN